MTVVPTLSEFDAATAVAPRSDGGSFDIRVDEGFAVGPKPNGGYLLAGIARATGLALAEAGSGHRDPLAATAHYLAAPDFGPATIDVEVLRTGRSASQARATLWQDDQRCVDVTLTMGTLPASDDAPDPDWSSLRPPDVAPIAECMRMPSAPSGGLLITTMDRADLRLDPSVLSFAAGAPSGRGEMKGWISFADERPIDPLSLLFFLDTLPPATLEVVLTGWVPTLSLTTYLRAAPAPGPLRVRMWAQEIGDGRVDEVCELWDSRGRLVGQATQLAGIRFGDSPIAPFPNET
ncbi:thioesterase family protein [Aquihabitans daechungensis]|uniref:thioesterase family protein n=1 Tax=Aquihabitans daechungensis TaxID=1052257 RepID=UPI003BA10296